jgi:hypothetical protein
MASGLVNVTAQGTATTPRAETALLTEAQVTPERLRDLSHEGFTHVALFLSASNAASELSAAKTILDAKLQLDFWIEVARNPALADAHPDWMASIQTHDEWRRRFPDFPKLSSNTVVKVYPWVPALYEETFDVHLRSIAELLKDKPLPRRIFLNDLQGAPSACGCGHHLCRWTTDYGPLKTCTRLPNDAAAKFVARVKMLSPQAEVVPVWTTECEEHDRDGLCGGVGCFKGTCWREWTAQLTPLANEAQRIGVLLPYRALQRDLPVYGEPAGWVAQALKFFTVMPARYESKGVPVDRLVAVVQGWDVEPAQLQAQIRAASGAGASGVVVAYAELDQNWQPRIHEIRK